MKGREFHGPFFVGHVYNARLRKLGKSLQQQIAFLVIEHEFVAI